MVERQEIARIIAEQKLNSSGMVNPQPAIRLGQLLKADIIAPLITENDARFNPGQHYLTQPEKHGREIRNILKIYLPSRSALVLRKI